ncbi:MAG: FecR domain-containing protein [Elusimicrobia bacterium]|nr:FecR domain-containing protein [Elusimicrobiota bacterium]
MTRRIVIQLLLLNTFILCGCLKCQDIGETGKIKKDLPESEEVIEAEDIEEEKPEGDFVYVEGNVYIMNEGDAEWKPVDTATVIKPGSEIKLDDNSFAQVNLSQNKELELNESTLMIVKEKDKKANIDVMYGSLKARIQKLKDEELEIKTPVCVAAVRGTEFAVVYEEEDSSEVEVYDGSVNVQNAEEKGKPESIVVEKDSWASVRAGRKPELKGEIDEQRALRWKHLELKKSVFMDARKLKRLNMETIRLEKMGKLVREPAKKERIKNQLEKINSRKEEIQKSLQDNEGSLKNISQEYRKLRQAKLKRRQDLIEKRKKTIMENRKDRIKERKKNIQQRMPIKKR